MRSDVERFVRELQEEKQQEMFDAQAELRRLNDQMAEVEAKVVRLSASEESSRAANLPLAQQQQSGEEDIGNNAAEESASLKRQLEEAVQEMKNLQVSLLIVRIRDDF
jgi:chromosome segregation ATPase